MNMLGPCVNPAEPPVQLLGVADPRLLEPVARDPAPRSASSGRWSSTAAGSTRSRCTARPRRSGCADGAIERLTIAPEDAGLERAPLGGDAGRRRRRRMRERLKALLMGYGTAAETAGGGAQRRRAADDRGHGGDADARASSWRCAGDRLGRAAAPARRRWSRSAMAEPGGVLGEIVARKRRGRRGAARRRRLADSRARGADAAQPRRRARPARRALHHGGEEGLALGRRAARRTSIRRRRRAAYAGVADAISVLTDAPYFGGSLDDLRGGARAS